MSGEEMSVALVGMGGYGEAYLKELLLENRPNGLRFVAAVDPEPARCSQLEQVRAHGVSIFLSIDEFFAKSKADLIVLATPPQFHCEQVCAALQHGSHVLCEKPLGSEPDQVRKMIEARDRAGKRVAIGYQWSFSPPIQHLKHDIMAGKFGKPLRFKTAVYWPRDEKYYKRNGWAGRQRDAQGRLVLDSPVNNACSHYLHNMFYVLGDKLDRSDQPKWVTAELYRANQIENYDTAVLQCQTVRGVDLLFIATHASQSQKEPLLRYEFENAVIHFGGDDGDEIIARMTDGSSTSYGRPIHADSPQKLVDVSVSIRAGKPPACGLEAASAQTYCMFAAQQSTPNIHDFPDNMIVVEDEPNHRRTYVAGLEKMLDRCFEKFQLPSDLGMKWAKPAKKITVELPALRPAKA
jgi:predicted dehydrogenase